MSLNSCTTLFLTLSPHFASVSWRPHFLAEHWTHISKDCSSVLWLLKITADIPPGSFNTALLFPVKLRKVAGQNWPHSGLYLDWVWVSQQRRYFAYFHCRTHRCCSGACSSSLLCVGQAPAQWHYSEKRRWQDTLETNPHLFRNVKKQVWLRNIHSIHITPKHNKWGFFSERKRERLFGHV